MLSFSTNLSPNNTAFALFVNEKYDYKDSKGILSEDVRKKVDLFIKSLRKKNQKDEISSLDISDKKKCFVIKVKKKYENYYFVELGGSFFTYIKNYKTINSVDIYADSLNENKEYLSKIFCEFIFGFNIKSYTFNKYKTLNKEKVNKKLDYKIVSFYKKNI